MYYKTVMLKTLQDLFLKEIENNSIVICFDGQKTIEFKKSVELLGCWLDIFGEVTQKEHFDSGTDYAPPSYDSEISKVHITKAVIWDIEANMLVPSADFISKLEEKLTINTFIY